MPIIESGLQPNHSEWMRLVATLTDLEKAHSVHSEFVRHLEELFSRGDKFSCSGFGRWFKTKKEFREWKKNKWDPVADERCTLSVEKRNGGIYVSGDYGLILNDWSREEMAIALDGTVIALRVYTVGYGLDHVEDWLAARGALVQVSVEGEEYEYRSFDDALRQAQGRERRRTAIAGGKTQAGKKRSGGVRAKNRHDRPV